MTKSYLGFLNSLCWNSKSKPTYYNLFHFGLTYEKIDLSCFRTGILWRLMRGRCTRWWWLTSVIWSWINHTGLYVWIVTLSAFSCRCQNFRILQRSITLRFSFDLCFVFCLSYTCVVGLWMLIVYLLLISLLYESLMRSSRLLGDFGSLILQFINIFSRAKFGRRLRLNVILAHVEYKVTTLASRHCRLPKEVAPGYRKIYHVLLLFLL